MHVHVLWKSIHACSKGDFSSLTTGSLEAPHHSYLLSVVSTSVASPSSLWQVLSPLIQLPYDPNHIISHSMLQRLELPWPFSPSSFLLH